MEFQSTLPARGATGGGVLLVSLEIFFKAHTPALQPQPCSPYAALGWRYFTPRSPHGERPGWSILSAIISVFQSTLPARGATFNQSPFAVHASFQSTLPARGATGNRARYWYRCHFNPRSPHGERRYSFLAARRHSSISIHAPRTGSDYFIYQQQSSLLHFNPRSPHGERRQLLE